MAPATKTKTRARPREAKPALTKTTKADRGRNDVAELLRLMRAIEHRLQSSSKLMARDGGVTGPQRTVLRAITKEPGLSASDVAEVVQLHASTVTGIPCSACSRRGLVSRRKSDDDGRKGMLEVTDAPAARRTGSSDWTRDCRGSGRSQRLAVLASCRRVWRRAAPLPKSSPATSKVRGFRLRDMRWRRRKPLVEPAPPRIRPRRPQVCLAAAVSAKCAATTRL